MKILLINPTTEEISLKHKRKGYLLPLNLAIIASLTPKDIEVKIFDENVEDINFDEAADLVGITSMTPTAPRAYYIADAFRKRGKKIVLGGIHPSSLPDEALNYCDCVGVGEAEGFWLNLIYDFKGGKLQKIYKPPDEYFEKPLTIPLASRHLLKRERYYFPNSLQTTRGCPYNCAFCAVTKFFGNRFRHRAISEVLDEISTFKSRYVGFVDDNIIGSKARAKELFKALIPHKIRWMSQGSIDITDDEELLSLAAKSGCISLFVGFESLVRGNLEEIGKKINIKRKFEEAIKKLHSYKISLVGAFIFGFDADDEGVIKKTVKFAKKMRIEVAQFGILTPFPGTKIWEKLKEEGRIFDFDWKNYDITHVVFKTKNFAPGKLQEKFHWAYRNFYSLPSILRRIDLFARGYKYLLLINFAFRKVFFLRKAVKPLES